MRYQEYHVPPTPRQARGGGAWEGPEVVQAETLSSFEDSSVA